MTIALKNRKKSSSSPEDTVTKEALEALISRLEFRAVVFGVVVGVGVVGEAVYGFRIWWNNRKLHKIETEENLSLQHDIARLNVEALNLKRQLLLQGPRNELCATNRQSLTDALKPFGGQKIDVRHTVMIGAWNGVATGTQTIFKEESDLADCLIGVLTESGWQVPKRLLSSRVQGEGISIQIVSDCSRATRKAAWKLAEVLRDIPFTVSDPTSVPYDSAKRTETENTSPQFGKDTIVLVIHPKPPVGTQSNAAPQKIQRK